MPSQTSAVGPLPLPIAAGALGDRIADPAVDALLDFLSYSLNASLNAKLANVAGTSTTAVPTANRFPFNPTDPRGHHVRLPVPSLFVWWDGKSQPFERMSAIYEYRQRELQVLYVFDELPSMAAMTVRAGLLAAVDATFFKAAERGYDPAYAYGSAAAGQLLQFMAADPDLFSFTYQGGSPGRFGINAPEGGADSGRDYPALRGSFLVRERIEQPTMTDEDVAGDVDLTIRASDGSSSQAVDLMQRYLPGPDGSELDE